MADSETESARPPLKPSVSQSPSYDIVHATCGTDSHINESPIGAKRDNLSFSRKRGSSTSNTRKCKQQRKYLKLIFHSTLCVSICVLIVFRVSILWFLFYECSIIMLFFDIYYLLVIIKSNHLHWYQHKLTSIPGIFGMAVPTNCKERENTHRFIGSISELSSYPGSTPHFVLSTTSTFVFMIGIVFGVIVLEDHYHYDFGQYPYEIAAMILLMVGAFGFLLAGHWSVFENKMSTNIHTIGFFVIWVCSTVAIFIQQKGHFLCIIGAVLVFILFGIFGYIRHHYVLFEWAEFESAHKYSIIEIFNEIIVVLVIEAQCLVFMWTVIREKDH